MLWATVTAASPLRVRIDGAATAGPATAPVGLSLAVGHRVVCVLVGRTLIVINRYA